MNKINSYFFAILLFFNFNSVFSSERYQDKLLLELIMATPGSVIEIPAGKYEFDSQLSLSVDGVTIKGKGMGKSILSFKNQTQGAEGLLVTSNNILLQDFTIEDTKGDAIKIHRSENITVRGVETRWTRGPHNGNGGYGFYPVQSRNILIESSVASGASDAGIYVGQSQNVIIRRNKAYLNVAGIEVENSTHVDVYDNYVTKNTGGILIFNLPDLSVFGEGTRVYSNTIVENNTVNFSSPSNTVADLPTGTGIMITANKKVEIFENFISENNTANVLIVSYAITGRPINDPDYDPFVESVYIYDNTFIGGGNNPIGGASENTQIMIETLKAVLGTPFPHIIYDGSFHPGHQDSAGNTPQELKLCIGPNHELSFLNLDFPNEFENISMDLSPHQCTLEKLSPVILNL